MRRAKEKKMNTHIPWVLVLSPGGEPQNWIDYDKYAYYKAKDSIIYSLGKSEYMLHGGINARTQMQSTLSLESIIAVRNESGKKRKRNKIPLTNSALFSRDNYCCAYCGETFKRNDLTRDHVHPTSKGGKDEWENVVTACFDCNQKKGNLLLDECDMGLLYTPYAPTHHENLILRNKKITPEQLEYLIIGVSPHSRVYKEHAHKLKNGEINEFV
jgi:5-methylcytosine-specific restriction endonuclease McrA